MKVAIDVSGQFGNITGIEHSVDSLLNGLFTLPTEHELTVFSPSYHTGGGLERFAKDGLFDWRHLPGANIDTVPVFHMKEHPKFQSTPLRRKVANVIDGRIINRFRLADAERAIRQAIQKYDLFHAPNASSMRYLSYPIRRSILTIYDITPLLMPEMHKPEAMQVWAPYFEHAKKRSARIITISEQTKRDVVEHLGIPEDRVDVTPLAPRSSTRRVTDPEQINTVLRKFKLTETPFVLYSGTLEPRKNLKRLVEAFGVAVAEGHLPEHKLVLAGGNWMRHDLELRIHALELGLGGRVVPTGYVSNAEMNALMSSCEAFAYVSEYEGFGMPPLEAMVCGAPVVASNTTSLPEVVGDAGIQVDPLDVEAIAEALHLLLTDGAENARRRALSLERAKMFSWERTARLTLQSYEAAVL